MSCSTASLRSRAHPRVERCYFSTLEKQGGSYVTDDLREREDDIIWRVRVAGEWLYVYLLIEFQSQIDPWMAVRVMVYTGLLYQDLIKSGAVAPGQQLASIITPATRARRLRSQAILA